MSHIPRSSSLPSAKARGVAAANVKAEQVAAAKVAAEAAATLKRIAAAAPKLKKKLNLKVRATQMGYYKLIRRRVGDVFIIDYASEFSSTWMEATDPAAALKITTGLQALRAQHDEILGLHLSGLPAATVDKLQDIQEQEEALVASALGGADDDTVALTVPRRMATSRAQQDLTDQMILESLKRLDRKAAETTGDKKVLGE